MTSLDALVRSAMAQALGRTLIHSLWEGAAIALALAIVLSLTRSPRVRYAAACVAMSGLLLGFGATLYLLAPIQIRSVSAHPPIPFPAAPISNTSPIGTNPTSGARDLLPWLAPLWLAGVLLFQLRCFASWAAAGRLRRRGVCSPSSQWIDRIAALQIQLRMTTPVMLLESCFTEVPVVIGHLRPVILMPLGLLAGLPSAQIEPILLHELAHIRRADYLVNLLQTLAEGLFFYHPAAWWISNVIRTERENCCDDLVVATSGDAHEYATALAALAENRWTDPALAATGGNLVKRIRRLLAQQESPRSGLAPILSVGILLATGAIAFAAWESPAPRPPTPQVQYDQWLKQEVVYIITDREREDFKKLQSDSDRDRFIEDFWKRRDPTPGTPENEYKEEHYRRIAYVNDRFRTASALPGWKTDRGRIYIEYGPPDEMESHPSGGSYTRPADQGGAQTVTYPFEMWKYRYLEGIGNNVILEFVDKNQTGEYRLTMDPTEKEVAAFKPLAPPLNYRDLEAAVSNGGTMYNSLPIKVRVSYVSLTPSAVWAKISIQFDTKDLQFEDKDNVPTANVSIWGRLSTISRRPLAPFIEDVVSVRQTTVDLPAFIEANPSQLYEKSVPLEPGRYRLNLLAKDLASMHQGRYEMLIVVPEGTP